MSDHSGECNEPWKMSNFVIEMVPLWRMRFFLCHVTYHCYSLQCLTQTFRSSGPQDHQPKGSGGPTNFLVVLTTTLVNLEPNFYTHVRCFHMDDDKSRPQTFMPLMITNTCFVPWKGREWHSVSTFITRQWRQLLRFFEHVTIFIWLDILEVHRTTGYDVLVVRHNFRGFWSTVSVERCSC